MALTFVASTPIITTANNVNKSNSPADTGINKSGNHSYVNGGPMDVSLANEEKIIEMLKKEGKLSENATLEEAHAAFIAFMEMGCGYVCYNQRYRTRLRCFLFHCFQSLEQEERPTERKK